MAPSHFNNNQENHFQMKKRNFLVPEDSIVEFAEAVETNQLTNTIAGTTEDDEIIIEIEYEQDERGAILDLMEVLDEDQF